MKKLSIEEKAKAYDEAIERANELNYVSDKDSLQRKTVEHIFPELKESEDERIRKELIDFIYDKTDTYELREKSNSWLAWLEKQHEQSFSNNIWYGANEIPQIKSGDRSVAVLLCENKEIWNVAHYYSEYGFLCHGKTVEKSTIIKWTYLDGLIERQGEQRIDENIQKVISEHNTIFKSIIGYYKGNKIFKTFIINLQNWWDNTCRHLNAVSRKKPAEWSDEDAEWSDEDAVNLTNTIRALQSLGMIQEADHRYDNLINWVKSLKCRCLPQPKPKWKPSEEQMEAVEKALSLAKNCGEEYSFDLRKLLEQLKAL